MGRHRGPLGDVAGDVDRPSRTRSRPYLPGSMDGGGPSQAGGSRQPQRAHCRRQGRRLRGLRSGSVLHIDRRSPALSASRFALSGRAPLGRGETHLPTRGQGLLRRRFWRGTPGQGIAPMKSEAQSVVDACRIIAGFSDSPDSVMRTYLSPAVREVHAYLRGWMDRLGMGVTIDAVGNLRGLHRSKRPRAPRLLLGSHIDTVPGSGAYDGVLGVVIALSLIESLEEQRLDFDVEVIAFSEEEGVRFATPFIGSRALIGEIDDALLQRADAQGITIEKAIEEFGLSPAEIPEAVLHEDSFAYVEFHIEQGPVLEDLNVGLGIVEAIVGQSRHELSFCGKSNHAGTAPMHLRHDALAGAAEWISAVERAALATPGLVATVGRVEAFPGAANVIPGEARVSFDIRHAVDSTRLAATAELLKAAGHIASARGLGF